MDVYLLLQAISAVAEVAVAVRSAMVAMALLWIQEGLEAVERPLLKYELSEYTQQIPIVHRSGMTPRNWVLPDFPSMTCLRCQEGRLAAAEGRLCPTEHLRQVVVAEQRQGWTVPVPLMVMAAMVE